MHIRISDCPRHHACGKKDFKLLICSVIKVMSCFRKLVGAGQWEECKFDSLARPFNNGDIKKK